MARWWLAFALLSLLLAPADAWACAVCLSMRDEARQAFKDTAIFLTLLPFVFVGGIGWWVRRALRAADLDEGNALPAPPSSNG